MGKLVERATYSRPRPGRATAEQVAAWQALARAFTASARASAASLSGTRLDPSGHDVLATLAEGPGEGLRPGELAQRVPLTRSGMTRLIDRLEERGLIERRVCPTDRRGQLVTLTRKGRYLLARATPGLLRALGSAMGGLSPSDVAALRRIAGRIEEAATAHSAE
ncbi:MAG: MarR family transcriptional regulator [Chloroflexi bacterium]|nr:MarR family transcriptional regulator [Chloroflexota bacterium]